ncbi:MAG: formimidoylglutamate deiminase [Hyphomicrobiales bacterium]|nr:formimidoylglutamate deiminase [Hyphomicrobiales bacterium]MBV8443072.1 formimidoylglutamate deiminase [Hyphomicrobiales bacterium]
MPILHAASALLPAGWRSEVRLTLENGAIAAIEMGVPPRDGDERHAILIPAIANVHSHAFQRAMAGLAEIRGEGTDTFWTWRETMYRFALTMTPDDVEAVASQLYVEMLEAGFAAVAEFHYLHHAPDGSPYASPAEMADRIVAATRAAGIGLTLLPVFYAHSTFGGAAPKPEQKRFITDVGAFQRLVEDCRRTVKGRPNEAIGVAPHSLRAVTPGELSEVVAIAGDGPIHIHVAEQVKEVEDCVAWSGARPVRWLLDHAAVDDRWCLVHATHMDEGETRDAANSRAVAGLCPITEANLGDGVFNAEQYLRQGGRFGIGSDSNVSIGAGAELRQLEYAQRLKARARNVLASRGGSSGRTMLDAVSSGGSQALMRRSGRLATGAVADIVALSSDHPTLAGKAGDQILDAWIFSAGNGAVSCVWSGGQKVVVDGRHVSRDPIGSKFRTTMRRLSEP